MVAGRAVGATGVGDEEIIGPHLEKALVRVQAEAAGCSEKQALPVYALRQQQRARIAIQTIRCSSGQASSLPPGISPATAVLVKCEGIFVEPQRRDTH